MKLFVWDFHGTLEKGNDVKVQKICEKLLGRKVDLQLVRKLYGRTWGEYFRELTGNDDDGEIGHLVDEAVNMGAIMTKGFMQANDYAIQVLREIKIRGDLNAVLSNTRPEHLREFLCRIGAHSLFGKIIGISRENEVGKHNTPEYKAATIAKMIKEFSPEKVVVIGDAENDINAGMRVGAVTFMFDPWGRYPDTKADYRITDLREVLKVY